MECELCHRNASGLIRLRVYTQEGIQVCEACYNKGNEPCSFTALWLGCVTLPELVLEMLEMVEGRLSQASLHWLVLRAKAYYSGISPKVTGVSTVIPSQ